LDSGAMMSIAFTMSREDRMAVASFLGTEASVSAPPASAFCADRTVKLAAAPKFVWNGWSPGSNNARFQPAEAAGLSLDQVRGLKLKWAFGFDGDATAFAPPTFIDGQIFVGSAGGVIHALRAESGCLQWVFQANGPVRSSIVSAPFGEQHALLFGDMTGWFYAVEAETGKLLWKVHIETHDSTRLTAAPVVHDGIVFVPVASWEETRAGDPEYACCTFRGSVVALRIRDGSQLWKTYMTPEPKETGKNARGISRFGPSGVGVWSAPTLDAKRGLLYVATGDNYSLPATETSDAVIALDMRRIGGIAELDRESRIVTVGAGMRAPELERRLAMEGLTLGHWPQSFEYVSLGGCVASRSAGQASSGYGNIARMVLGLRMVAPAGDIALQAMPASAAGPGLRELIVGSEGTLGAITAVSLRVRRAPALRSYEGVMFESFAAGINALRAMAQERALPDVARLSDAPETHMSMLLAGDGGLKGRLGRAYLGARGYGDRSRIGQRAGRCIAIVGFEGDSDELKARRGRALALAHRGGGLALGGSPGRAWLAGRFQAPYLRDELLTHGVMVETLETATRWCNVPGLHDAVAGAIARALEAQGTPGIVMCHVSHLYETGASLYYTFIARQRAGAEIEQWRAVKRAASEAIVSGGGTITHHHAVGRDHAPWLEREIGVEGVAAIRALKAELDPAGIMNPGKLVRIGASSRPENPPRGAGRPEVSDLPG